MKKNILFFLICICYVQVSPAAVIPDSLLNLSTATCYTNPELSYNYAKRAYQLGQTKNDTIRALILLGTTERLKGNFDLSFYYFYEALEKDINIDYKKKINILVQMSIIYCNLSDYAKAFSLNNQAYNMSVVHNDSVSLSASLNNKGLIYNFKEEYRIADSCFKKALCINRKLKDQKHIASNLNNLCLHKQNFKEQLAYINEAIKINTLLNSTWGLAENYNNMGLLFFYEKEYTKALKILKKAKYIANRINAKALISDNYEYSSWTFAALHKYKEAYEMDQKLYQLNSELQKDRRLRVVENNIAEKKVLCKKEEAQLKEQVYKVKILQKNLIILLCIISVFIAIAIIIPYWYKKKKRIHLMRNRIKLIEMEKELSELKMREQEQKLSFIQKELSHSKQDITNFAMYLKSRNELLDKIQEQVRAGYTIDASNIGIHLKRINLFIKQAKNKYKEIETIQLSIEEKNTLFLQRLEKKHPKLTEGEKKIAILMRINLSTKDICMLTEAKEKTVSMRRYRLRKTLGLNAKEDLCHYLQSI